MASNSPATSSSWGRRSAAVAGAGVASTTASASISRPAARDDPRPARRTTVEPFGRGRSTHTSTPRARRPVASASTSDAMPSVERPEERRPVGQRCGHLGAQGPHQAAPALRGRQERRERGGGRHVVHRAGVDAADERVDQRVDDALAELARHEGPDGAVADRPPGVGPGQHGIAGEAERAADADDARARRGPEPGGDPEGVPLGQRAQASAGPDRRAPGRDGHERVGEPHLVAQVDRLGPAAEEPVGTQVDRRARRSPRSAGAARGGATPRAAVTAGASGARRRPRRSAPRPRPGR